MGATLIIHDETTTGTKSPEFALEFLTERITVRELIRSRVYQEVQDYNLQKRDNFDGLIRPTDAEQALNGAKPSRHRHHVEWKPQYEAAVAAFQKNGFLVLVGDRQVEGLDEVIEIKPDTRVTFLKLVLLAGG